MHAGGRIMDIKAIFLDIDNTFFDHTSNRVLPETIEACKTAKQNGYKVVLCSGRPKEMADQLEVFDMVDWDGYIGCTGALVLDENYECIHHDAFSEQQLEEIFSLAKKHDLTIYSFGKYEFITRALDDYSRKIALDFHLSLPEVRTWNKEELSAISVLGDKELTRKIFENIENISITSTTRYANDFIRSDVDKARGIRFLMNHWGYEEGAYLAFGDSLNDIEMIKDAKIGIVMGNGSDQIKECADIICGNANEPSIYNMLKKLQII